MLNAELGMSCLGMPGPVQYTCMASPPVFSKKVIAIGYEPTAKPVTVPVFEVAGCNPSLFTVAGAELGVTIFVVLVAALLVWLAVSADKKGWLA